MNLAAVQPADDGTTGSSGDQLHALRDAISQEMKCHEQVDEEEEQNSEDEGLGQDILEKEEAERLGRR